MQRLLAILVKWTASGLLPVCTVWLFASNMKKEKPKTEPIV